VFNPDWSITCYKLSVRSDLNIFLFFYFRKLCVYRQVKDVVYYTCVPGVVYYTCVPGVVYYTCVPGVVYYTCVPGVVYYTCVPGVVYYTCVPSVHTQGYYDGVNNLFIIILSVY